MRRFSPRQKNREPKRAALSPKSTANVLSPRSEAGCDANELLDQSLDVLHRSLEQAQSDLIPSKKKKQANVVKEVINSPVRTLPSAQTDENNAWLLGVFSDLKSEKEKKQNYKNQLKDALRDRLQWLEGQLVTAGKADGTGSWSMQCSAGRKNETEDEFLSALDNIPVASIDPPAILSPTQEQDGYEIYLKSDAQNPREKELEDKLALTLQKHDEEREEWFKVLEKAAMVTAKGQQLSSHQEKQLRDLQDQFAKEQMDQRRQLKEKSKVLKQLLDLTEQQQGNERKEWEDEVKLYEQTIARMSSDRAKVDSQVKTMVKELAETQEKVKSLFQEKQRLLREKDATAKHLSRVSGQKDEWKGDKEAYENTVTQLIADKDKMRKQITRLQDNLREKNSRPPLASKSSPGRLSKLEEKLDRVSAERDINKQEAERLAELVTKQTAAIEALKKESTETKESLKKERRKWEDELAAKDREVQEAKVSVERQVVERMEDVLRERQESTKENDDSDWAAKYEESIQKRNELVSRLRKMEETRGVEKGEWKLKLESALAEARVAVSTAEDLERKLNEQREHHEKEVDVLEERLKSQRKEFLAQVDDLKSEKNAETKEEVENLLKVAKEEANDEVERLRARHAKEMEQVTTELESLKEEVSTIRGEFTTKDNVIATLQAENKADRQVFQEERKQLELEFEQEVQLRKSHLMHSEAEVEVLSEQLNELNEKFRETRSLKERYEALAEENGREAERRQSECRELHETIAELRKKTAVSDHASSELREWKELARKSQEEAQHLSQRIDHCESLKDRLEVQLRQLQLERDRYKHECELPAEDRELNDSLSKDARLQHKNSISISIEELRQDIVAIRETIESSNGTSGVIADSNFAELRTDIEQLQSSIQDVCAELTLETEAMYETRSSIESITTSATSLVNTRNSEELLSRVSEMNDNIKKIVGGELHSETSLDEVRLELLKQLETKDLILSEFQNTTESVKQELAAEVEKREKAEVEIKTLNDQADAYTEELMHLQADNARLSATLKEAERKMVSVLYAKKDPDDISALLAAASRNGGDDSLPILDGALALAQSISDIVQGQNGERKDTTVMEMLESLSEKMDLHDRGELPGQSKSSDDVSDDTKENYPPSPHSIDEDMRRLDLYNYGPEARTPSAANEDPPPPVETPLEVTIPAAPTRDGHLTVLSPGNQNIQTVVEQLYGRCQLLERERLELMETTLDLLESARQASKAELDAALATARRKASDDIVKVVDKNNVEKERLYRKLCNRCVHSLPCESFPTLPAEE